MAPAMSTLPSTAFTVGDRGLRARFGRGNHMSLGWRCANGFWPPGGRGSGPWGAPPAGAGPPERGEAPARDPAPIPGGGECPPNAPPAALPPPALAGPGRDAHGRPPARAA